MAVAEDDRVDSGKVYAERFGVFYYRIGLPGIKQKFMLFCFDIYTQSVFRNAFFLFGSIFDKRYYFHYFSP